MKTLKNHTIIYDDDCPMCHLYTGAFIKTGMLDENGRVPYSNVVGKADCNVDWKRACNEIALIDKDKNQVTYGIRSLFKIIGYYFPFLKALFRFQPFVFIMEQFYFFISYNRKVIAPVSINRRKIACYPDLKMPYRWAYIVISWLITALVLQSYSSLLISYVPPSGFYRELIVCGGQIAFQSVFILLIGKGNWIDYIGNLMTVSLIGAILLLPVILLSHFISMPSVIYLAYFFLVVTFMLFEHMRRVKMLALPSLLTLTWVVYRLLVLLIVF